MDFRCLCVAKQDRWSDRIILWLGYVETCQSMSKHVKTCQKFSNLAITIDMAKSPNGKMSMWIKVQIEIVLTLKSMQYVRKQELWYVNKAKFIMQTKIEDVGQPLSSPLPKPALLICCLQINNKECCSKNFAIWTFCT